MPISLSSIRGNCHYLGQGVVLLERVSPVLYASALRPGWAPVGGQFRHVLDHYRSFLLGWPEGRIDYDARLREPLLETDPVAAARAAGAIAKALENVHVEDGDRVLMVQMNSGGNDGVPDWRPSTVGRELQFLVSHTVHHYALIRILLEDCGVDVPGDFGVAPSTLAHETTRNTVAAMSRTHHRATAVFPSFPPDRSHSKESAT